MFTKRHSIYEYILGNCISTGVFPAKKYTRLTPGIEYAYHIVFIRVTIGVKLALSIECL